MSMQGVAELGYFIIRIIEVNELNLTVGLEKNGHPQIYYIPNQGRVEEANAEKLQAIREKVDERLSSYDSQIQNLFITSVP
jgi:hypothetical protein